MVDLKAKSTIYSVIALVGALIGIIGIFVVWMEYEFLFIEVTRTGWEFITNSLDNPDFSLDGYVKWTPLIVLVFSVIGLIVALLGIARPGRSGGIGAAVSGIFVLLGAILFILYSDNGFKMSEYIGMGVYLAVIAGVILLIFGILMTRSKATN